MIQKPARNSFDSGNTPSFPARTRIILFPLDRAFYRATRIRLPATSPLRDPVLWRSQLGMIHVTVKLRVTRTLSEAPFTHFPPRPKPWSRPRCHSAPLLDLW